MGIINETLHAVDLDAFVSGGLQTLKSLGSLRNGFSGRTKSQFFTKEILQKLFPAIQSEIKKRSSYQNLKDFDGNQATLNTRPTLASQKRIYTLWFDICNAWNQQHASDNAKQIDLTKIHTEDGARLALQIMGIIHS